jgi:hypothetical protein
MGTLRFSNTTFHGARRRCPTLSGSHSQTSGNASQVVTMVHTVVMSRMFVPHISLGPHAVEDSERAIAANIIQQKQ